jgi:hypothetical protein
MRQLVNYLTNQDSDNFARKIGDVFKGAPSLPKEINEFFVKAAPWVAGLLAFFSILNTLSFLSAALGAGRGVSMMAFQMLGVSPFYFFLKAILAAITAVVLIYAFTPLKERRYEGWLLLFWYSILVVIGTILDAVMITGFAIFSLLFILIGFYVLYQIRPFYRGQRGQAKTDPAKTDQTESSS